MIESFCPLQRLQIDLDFQEPLSKEMDLTGSVWKGEVL